MKYAIVTGKKIAVDCVAYLQYRIDISTGKKTEYRPVELKWQGLTTPRSLIPAKHSRFFDAFIVPLETSNKIYFGLNWSRIDFIGYSEEYCIVGPGTFKLGYLVFSLNFQPVEKELVLRVGNRLDDIRFYSEFEDLRFDFNHTQATP